MIGNKYSLNCGGENGGPRITPCLDFIILEYKSTYNLRCEAEEPVTWWSIHNKLMDVLEESNHSTSLSLNNVSAGEVGAYYCIKKSEMQKNPDIDEAIMAENVNLELASSIYVYVNDSKNKLVPHQPVSFFGLYDNLLIPCKPSMPNTTVLLKSEGDELFSQNTPNYNPKRGFELKNNRFRNGTKLSCVSQVPFKENMLESIIYTAKTTVGFKQRDRPIIESNLGHYVIKGSDLILRCDQTASVNDNNSMTWSIPLNSTRELSLLNIDTRRSFKMDMTHEFWYSELKVKNAQPTDSGAYECKVNDNDIITSANYHIKVLESNQVFLNINKQGLNSSDHFDCLPGERIWINASFNAYPRPTIHWYKPNGSEIWPSEINFGIFYDKSSTALRIDVQQEDTGTYVLLVDNIFLNDRRKYNVSVRRPPELLVPNSEVYVQAGGPFKFVCYVRAVPPAVVSFNFCRCNLQPRWPNCNNSVGNELSFTTKPAEGNGYSTYEVTFTPRYPGVLKIFANSTVDKKYETADAQILLSDLSDRMTINVDEHPLGRKTYRRDTINVTCGAVAYHYNNNLLWLRDGRQLNDSNRFKIIHLNGTFSYKSILQISNIDDDVNGTYLCRAYRIDRPKEFQKLIYNLTIYDTPPPEWHTLNTPQEIKMGRLQNESLMLECSFNAVDPFTATWFKDNKELTQSNETRIEMNRTNLYIHSLLPKDQGVYKCRVTNLGGSIEKSVRVIVTDPNSAIRWVWLWVGIIIGLIMVIFFASLAVFYFRAHKRHLALNADKAEEPLVQYTHVPEVFEIPRHNLKLGKQLGEGAFGVVLKGEAKGIRKDEVSTNVAVKMARRSADSEVMQALMAELNIMIRLGQHLNVVNLLGAITNNVEKHELMVIVEYCRFGNIHNVLLKNRSHFVNQINPMTDKIDTSSLISLDTDTDPHDEATLYNPIWGSNYETDSTKPITLTTSNLVSWAFQVARGMEYLSSKQVLHGDLAARNILLCDKNVVKICDFGLARSLYQNYYKKENGKMPIKWLALESLTDHVFSTYSDVWSFGIVLWEMFSLAKVPYPGIDPSQLLNKLNDGYRMEKPPYANQEIYEIMLECWRKIPKSRPLFDELVQRFSQILGAEICNQYVDMNNPYIENNLELAKVQPTDYEALKGSPDEPAPSVPINTK
ncbi:vascular endothelial growth factor receptor 1-like [Drosophila bipectinata]|uniref:vascular endothelial growth factor receptor 1-like n=1 Tax=Drosophila bipectinata TaxID=42026 RepID=UPI0038B28331